MSRSLPRESLQPYPGILDDFRPLNNFALDVIGEFLFSVPPVVSMSCKVVALIPGAHPSTMVLRRSAMNWLHVKAAAAVAGY